jgi:hypothetical protein
MWMVCTLYRVSLYSQSIIRFLIDYENFSFMLLNSLTSSYNLQGNFSSCASSDCYAMREVVKSKIYKVVENVDILVRNRNHK